MLWEPLAKWGLLDSDFDELSPHPPTMRICICGVTYNTSRVAPLQVGP